MNAKTVVPNIVTNVAEIAVKPVAEEAKNQIAPISRDLLKMIYWSDSTPPDHRNIVQKNQLHTTRDSQALQEVRKKHAELLGGTANQTTPAPEAIRTNPVAQTNNSVIMEHHREAEQLGVLRQNEEELKKRQMEQEEEEKKLAQEKARLASLENPIEAQGKAPTGFGGKRKSAGVKMQKAPKTNENKIGQGGRE